MIARITSIKVPDDKIKDAVKMWKEQWGPLIVKQSGCLTHLMMRNREHPGQLLSLSLWASQHVIDDYVASPAREEIRKNTRGDLAALEVTSELFDVVH
jgi:quinol monooxygenase YgiN